MTEELQVTKPLQAALAFCTQDEAWSGGMCTAPAGRLLLYALATSFQCKDILETGYDAGYTTRVLAETGAKVTAIDDESEYPEVKQTARALLKSYPNITLLYGDALGFLRSRQADSFDMIFLDDDHEHTHVQQEVVEALRVLRPGGLLAMHDTVARGLWAVLLAVLSDAPGWQVLNVPAYQGTGEDMGIGLARKPG